MLLTSRKPPCLYALKWRWHIWNFFFGSAGFVKTSRPCRVDPSAAQCRGRRIFAQMADGLQAYGETLPRGKALGELLSVERSAQRMPLEREVLPLKERLPIVLRRRGYG